MQPLAAPEMEFANDDKGEALYAMELALSLEKLNFQKLQALQAIADKHKDAALCDFVEGGLLSEQVWSRRAQTVCSLHCVLCSPPHRHDLPACPSLSVFFPKHYGPSWSLTSAVASVCCPST